MTTPASEPTIAVLLSGGLDSATLLGTLIRRGRRVQPLYVRSGLIWEHAELRAIHRFLQALDSPRVAKLAILDLPVQDVYGEHWSITGDGSPDASSLDNAVYLPGRNLILLVKAGLWCRLHGIRRLALGVLASNPFADATPGFFRRLETVMNLALGGEVRIVRPLARLHKRQVMKLGRDLPLELTFSCIAPVGGLHCGRCNKCAERANAFAMIGRDPTRYATPLGTRSGS